MRSIRLRKALVLIAGNLRELARQSEVIVTGDLQAVIDAAGGAQASVIDSQLPPDTDLVTVNAWSRVDAHQLAAIVQRSTQQITARHLPLEPQAYDAVRRELIRGVAAGSNPKVTARRMVQRAEKKFNGGLNRALNIARTETLDAHRAGGALGMSQHADVLRGWEWLATLDEHTCPSCWGMHGSVHALSDPGPLDHQQGRCARNPLTKSWADLGIDIPEPPSITPDAETTFAGLTAEAQKNVLGPKRYEAWKAGDYPIDSWSTLKHTPGWRDSYVVSPAPASSGGRAVA
jgi:SPP1 gp7 family putative phage head morphogenesis protein